MAREAINRFQHMIHVRGVDDVDYRMPLDRVAVPVLQRQQDHFLEVVFGQFHFAVEDRDQMLALQLLRIGFRPMALQAELVGRGGAQLVLFPELWDVRTQL